MKTNKNQTICDEAEQLWTVYMTTKNHIDREKYIRHVEECDECFITSKKMKEEDKKLKIERDNRIE